MERLPANLRVRVRQDAYQRRDAQLIHDVVQKHATVPPHSRAGVMQARPGRFAGLLAHGHQALVGTETAMRISQHLNQLSGTLASSRQRERHRSSFAARTTESTE
jgi:hypothetical protein